MGVMGLLSRGLGHLESFNGSYGAPFKRFGTFGIL